MLGVRLDEKLEARLNRLAENTGRSKSYYAREAIREYVEDREDYEVAVAAAKDAAPHISLEELIRKYGLDDQLRQESGKAVRKITPARSTPNRRIHAPAGSGSARSTRAGKSTAR